MTAKELILLLPDEKIQDLRKTLENALNDVVYSGNSVDAEWQYNEAINIINDIRKNT